MSRSVELWTGRTDDSAIPPRVRIRVFERCKARCSRCNRKIGPADKWSIEHMIALVNGGANAEANLGISCAWCKPIKDAEDVAIKAHSAKVVARHLGVKPPSRFQSRPFGYISKRARRERERTERDGQN